MFTNNKFGKFDAVADAIKSIAEADYKAKMEQLKGQQHKIDKNKNNKIDAHDFAILRGENKGMKKEEAENVEEDTSVKIPTSTGTKVLGHRYGNAAKTHRDSMADPFAVVKGPKDKDLEDLEKKKVKKEEIDPNKVTTDTLAGVVKGKTANPFAPKKVMMDVPDNVKEEAEDMQTLHNDIKSAPEEQGVAEGSDDELNARPGMWRGNAKRMTSKGKPTKDELGMQDNLKNRIKASNKKGGITGPKGPLPEEQGVAEDDPLAARQRYAQQHKTPGQVYKPTYAGDKKGMTKAYAYDIKRTGPKGKLPEEQDERELSKGETAEKERIVKGMKKSLAGFKSRYGDKAKSVMYATATKQAKKD